MSIEIRANPFRDRGLWYWRDDHEVAHGPYESQMGALRALMHYIDDDLPEPWWKRALNRVAGALPRQ